MLSLWLSCYRIGWFIPSQAQHPNQKQQTKLDKWFNPFLKTLLTCFQNRARTLVRAFNKLVMYQQRIVIDGLQCCYRWNEEYFQTLRRAALQQFTLPRFTTRQLVKPYLLCRMELKIRRRSRTCYHADSFNGWCWNCKRQAKSAFF